MFEQAFRNIDDVLRKEAGCTTELDYTEQTSWLLFLEYLDGLEEEKALEKFLALSEPDAPRLQQLAELYLRRGDFVRAEQMLRRVIAMGDADKKLYTQLGEVILQAQQQANVDAAPVVISPGGSSVPYRKA